MSIPVESYVALFSLLVGLAKTFKFVQEGELGIRLTFGKAQRRKDGKPNIINPGFVLMVPWVQTLRRHHVRQNAQHLDNQSVMISEGLIFTVSAVVIYRVTDIYKALFEIDNLDGSIHSLCMGIIREVLSSKKHNELNNMKQISGELLTELKEKAHEWGVEFIQFNLTDCAPSAETAPLVIAEAGVSMKMKALKRAAEENKLSLEEFSPVLAAALVGTPLVASITSHFRTVNEIPTKSPKKSLLGMLTGDEE